MDQTEVDHTLDLLKQESSYVVDITQELIGTINRLPYKKVEAQHIEDLARSFTLIQKWTAKMEERIDALIVS